MNKLNEIQTVMNVSTAVTKGLYIILQLTCYSFFTLANSLFNKYSESNILTKYIVKQIEFKRYGDTYWWVLLYFRKSYILSWKFYDSHNLLSILYIDLFTYDSLHKDQYYNNLVLGVAKAVIYMFILSSLSLNKTKLFFSDCIKHSFNSSKIKTEL